MRGTDDLATLVMGALAVQPATDATASAARYAGAELCASEQQREQQRQERPGELRRRFVDGPVLLLPGGGGGSFNSIGAVVIPGVGTVYFGPYRQSGAWGTLEADTGVLFASDGGSRRVSEPRRRDDATFDGEGWTFKAAPGWVVREGARRGDYEVVRQSRDACAGVTSLMACRVADACDHAERQAQPEIGRSDSLGRRSRAAAKATPRVFRLRVRVVSS